MRTVKPSADNAATVTAPLGTEVDPQEAWFDEAVVIDSDWAVIYTKRGDGSRRGIRVPLRAVLAAEDDDSALAAG